ncbi:hypothetical protein FOHLNKBM_4199 [Methylobacterium longum]|nr:hypothetical protein FOHLNKBM_4199 [Methylobacterium longum]
MSVATLAVALCVFAVATISARLLSYAGYENAPYMVLVSGLVAGGVFAALR